MNSEEFYAFLRDPKLTEIIEQNKTTDNLLDMINLHENQHSEVLAWCMNPNEGHSQGDAVIKDFLEAAYEAALDPKWDNKKFFNRWTPGRIRTSSFGTAFVTRELGIKVPGGASNARLDLFLVDTQNKILVTIENKAGASLSADQLEKYVGAVKAQVSSLRVFAGYDIAFVVLDRDLADYSEEYLTGLGNRWVLMDYSWLEASAGRAGFQLARGRNSAVLMVAYCQKQTAWKSPAETRISELATDLAMAYPAVIEALRKARKTSVLQWASKALDGVEGELTLFTTQHREVCEKLISIQGIAIIVRDLLRTTTSIEQDQVETGRTWLNAIPKTALRFREGEDSDWPLYMNLFRDRKASRPDSPKFRLRFVWARTNFGPAIDEPALRRYFETDFPGLGKFAMSGRRTREVANHLSPQEAVKRTAEWLDVIDARLQAWLKQYTAPPQI